MGVTPKHTRRSNQRPPMKKESTPKHKGLKSKTSDGKRGNAKMQVAQIKDLRRKKEATPKYKRLKQKASNEKKPKIKTVSLTKQASPNECSKAWVRLFDFISNAKCCCQIVRAQYQKPKIKIVSLTKQASPT
jgi:hypothetical protein